MSEPLHIKSLENPRVKEAVRLRSRRAREKTGRFLVEGGREIERALDAGLRPVALFACEGSAHASLRSRAAAAGAGVFTVAARVHRKLALRESGEEPIAVFPIPVTDPKGLKLPVQPLVLAVSGIEKPGNLGALLRSADGFGVDAFLVEGGTDLWNPNSVRASLGCVFSVSLATFSAGELLPWLREHRLRVVAATPHGGVVPAEIDWTGSVALVLGSEDQGLPVPYLAEADACVRLPMRGAADSLNVSVTAAVLLYEASRGRASQP
jgi:TrmH family RNA methyltransferase